jgi:hypothetical protein
MKNTISVVIATGIFCTAIAATAKATSISSLPDVGLLMPYTEFGYQEDQSLVTINGNVSISSGGTLHVFSPSPINGDVGVASGAIFQDDKSNNSNVHGTIFTGQNLTATQSQVSSASSAFSGLAPDQTFSPLNSTQNFSAPSGTVLVVDQVVSC